ncbi:hypothetical protein [Actinomadura macra]|uniref:hypothetical protein n=1 Tax=Actinomadura macra TaxID=46164 RepID=UPI00082B2F51|nr:hypothetical protein [Actinomadura macra]
MQKQQPPSDGESPHEGLSPWWVVPTVLIASARLVRAATNGTAWDRTSLALAVLALIAMVTVAIMAVRRRDYGTLGWIAAGTLVAGITDRVQVDPF